MSITHKYKLKMLILFSLSCSTCNQEIMEQKIATISSPTSPPPHWGQTQELLLFFSFSWSHVQIFSRIVLSGTLTVEHGQNFSSTFLSLWSCTAPNSSHSPHLVIEHPKCGQSKLKCAVIIKHIVFQDLVKYPVYIFILSSC